MLRVASVLMIALGTYVFVFEAVGVRQFSWWSSTLHLADVLTWRKDVTLNDDKVRIGVILPDAVENPPATQLPAVVGRNLESNARRSLEDRNQNYDISHRRTLLRNIFPSPPQILHPSDIACAQVVHGERHLGSIVKLDSQANAGDHHPPSTFVVPYETLVDLEAERQSDIVPAAAPQARNPDLASKLAIQGEHVLALEMELETSKNGIAAAKAELVRLQTALDVSAADRVRSLQAVANASSVAHRSDPAEGVRHDLEQALVTEKDRVAALTSRLSDKDRMLDRIRERLAQDMMWAGRAQSMSGSDGTERLVEDVAVVLSALPSDATAHIVVSYPKGRAGSRRRAEDLELALKARGLEVIDPIETRPGRAHDEVTFFYEKDAQTAKRISTLLATSAPTLGHAPPNAPPPRPGTIEVGLAD